MDSRLVIEQMSGRWQIKHPDLRPLARAARDTARSLGQVSYVWVPREQNRRADKLANDAMDGSPRLPRGAPERPGGAPPRERDARADPPAQPAAGSGARTQDHETRHPDTEPHGTWPHGAQPNGTRQAGPAAATGGTSGWLGHRGRPTTTVLLRHGQTGLSVERRFAGSGDTDLTEHGAEQARAAAERLRRQAGDTRIASILTSPLRRARRTAEEAARALGAPLRVDADLREADFGAWEGLTFAEAQEKWPGEMAAWLASTAAAPPGGESFAEVERRVMAAFDRLLGRYAGTKVLVVTHVTPIKMLVCRALLAPAAAMYRTQLDAASICEIDWYSDGNAVVRSLNDTAHLCRLCG